MIRTKRAVRRFTDQPVPEDQVRAILDAGRRAQSDSNSQPWHFIAIRDRETLQRLAECGTGAWHLAGAAFAVAIVSSVAEGFDLGQAAAYMQLAAWEQGIGSCIAYVDTEPERAKEILGIPADQYFVPTISFGYPQPKKPAQPTTRTGDGRRPFDDVVRWDRW